MDLVDGAGNSGHAAGSAVQCCAAKSRYAKGKGVCPAELGLKVFGEMPWLKRRCIAKGTNPAHDNDFVLPIFVDSTLWLGRSTDESKRLRTPPSHISWSCCDWHLGRWWLSGCRTGRAGCPRLDCSPPRHVWDLPAGNALWCGINTTLCPGCLRTESPTQEIQHPFHNSLPSTTTYTLCLQVVQDSLLTSILRFTPIETYCSLLPSRSASIKATSAVELWASLT